MGRIETEKPSAAFIVTPPLAVMASRRLSRAAAAGDVGAVDALLREGADPGFQVRPRYR